MIYNFQTDQIYNRGLTVFSENLVSEVGKEMIQWKLARGTRPILPKKTFLENKIIVLEFILIVALTFITDNTTIYYLLFI